MNMYVQNNLSDQIKAYFGTELSNFLAPVSNDSPSGEYLRYNGAYREINEARREDDASLPLGVWGHELKKANWPQVSRLTLSALTSRSKDIQLLVWLLEAEIHQQGFRAIAPVMNLLSEMCREFWGSIYPRMDDEDLDSRINLIAWIDDKLLPVLRLTPLTRRSSSGKDYGLADWLIARKNESLKKEERARLPKDSVTPDMLQRAMTESTAEYYLELRLDLIAALESVAHLCHTLDELSAGSCPSLSSFTELLGEILDLVEFELQRRGVSLASAQPAADIEDLIQAGAEADAYLPPHEDGMLNRTLLYQQLERMAQYLIETDPHSPAPYLVMQACKWGSMGTRELYQELFVNRQGQLHIFDLLGVNQGGEGERSAAEHN